MSKVKLVICEGYGSNQRPYLTEEAKVIDTGIEVPDTHDIVTLIRSDFDKDEDGTVRVSDEVDPVVRHEAINGLVGKLLTLVDATFTDVEQRKAQKDLVMKTCWEWYSGQGEMINFAARHNDDK